MNNNINKNKGNIQNFEELIIKEYTNITGIIVHKRGELEYEKYFNGYNKNNTVHIFSVTKSIFSALIGIAIDKGYIKSVDQKVLDFFPEYRVSEENATIHNITLKHLLTMTAPYKQNPEPFVEFFQSDNWMNFALNLLGGKGPAGKFLYSPIVGSHILSGILTKATGQPVLDFASKHLFSPLGIDVSQNEVLATEEEHMAYPEDKTSRAWVVDPQGINTASWGLTLSPGDTAKIGQLYLNNGVWDKKQIVPAQWVQESVKEHSQWEEMGLYYGYLWWVLDSENPIYAAMGDGGNMIYINTQKDLVISIAALFTPNAKDSIALIQKHIEPLF